MKPSVDLSKCPSYLTEGEWTKIAGLVMDNGFNSYMEVGVMRGGNLVRMSNLFELNEYDCKITAYDCFAELAPVDPKNTHTSGFQPIASVQATVDRFGYNVEFIQALARDAGKVIPEGVTYDVIFHDADHSYEGVYEDLVALMPFVSKGGFVCVHDVIYDESRGDRPRPYGGGKALQQLVEEGKYNWLETVDSMGVLQVCDTPNVLVNKNGG